MKNKALLLTSLVLISLLIIACGGPATAIPTQATPTQVAMPPPTLTIAPTGPPTGGPPPSENPFTSGSPELQVCLKQALGEELFKAFANRQRRPTEAENALIGKCMMQFGGPSGPPGGPGGPTGPGMAIATPTPIFHKRLPEPSLYKGFWEPTSNTARQMIIEDVDVLIKMGVNTISIGPAYLPNVDGSFSADPPWMEQGVLEQINAAHAKGLGVYLVPQFWSPYQKPDPKKADLYLENFAPIVLKWAEMAEQYGVEMFSPVNEPDHVFDTRKVSTWQQKLLPEIRKRYKGIVLPKLAQAQDIDYKGFDYVGFDLVGPREAKDIAGELNRALGYSQRDGCRGVIVAEFGVLATSGAPGEGQGLGDKTQADKINLVFQETWGKVKGYFIVGWTLMGYGVKGRPAQQTIEGWFKRK